MQTSTNSFEQSLDNPLYSPVHRTGQALLSRSKQWGLFIIVLMISDVLMTATALRVAYAIRFELSLPIFQLEFAPSFFLYQTVSLILIPLWIIIFASNGLYDRRYLLGGTQEYSRAFRATSIGFLLVVLAGFIEPTFILARGWMLAAWLLSFLAVCTARFVLRRIAYRLRHHGYFLTPSLIIGANEEGISLAQQLNSWRTSGLDVIGFVDDRTATGTPIYKNLHALGSANRLDDLIAQYKIEELILATSALSRAEIVAIFRRYGMVDGLNLRLSSGLFELVTTGLEVKEMAYTPLVTIHKVRLTGLDHLLKLALDYLITIPGLIAIAPMLLFIAIAVKLDSPGPVFYRRRVMGINGRQFDAFKFRTMHVNGDEILDQHPQLKEALARNHKLKEDPRITSLGHFLRRTSLDELPQLLNVLRREMSLIGPRMIAPNEMEMYDEWGLNLLTVAPGISGLWQVSGRSDVSYEQRVQLDMHYIRNWTIWLDIQIILQTIPAVLKGRGAY